MTHLIPGSHSVSYPKINQAPFTPPWTGLDLRAASGNRTPGLPITRRPYHAYYASTSDNSRSSHTFGCNSGTVRPKAVQLGRVWGCHQGSPSMIVIVMVVLRLGARARPRAVLAA
jgi:hypothetical protein